jgi:uridine kinase
MKMGVSILGIAGGSASGKTSLAHALSELDDASEVDILSLDSYYRCGAQLPMPERSKQNMDHPQSIDSELFIQHLVALRHGHAVDVPEYDFSTHLRKTETQRLVPRRFIVIEGLFILCFPEVRELLSYSVFVEASEQLRFKRRLSRDTKERGRTVESVQRQWQDTVEPMYRLFCEPTRSFATEVFSGEEWNRAALTALWSRFSTAC